MIAAPSVEENQEMSLDSFDMFGQSSTIVDDFFIEFQRQPFNQVGFLKIGHGIIVGLHPTQRNKI